MNQKRNSFERIALREFKRYLKKFKEVDRESYNLSPENGFHIYDSFGNKKYYVKKEK